MLVVKTQSKLKEKSEQYPFFEFHIKSTLAEENMCTLIAGWWSRQSKRKGESEQLSDYRLLLGMTHTINLCT